ncbi:MAG: riboflavin kinase, partial [Desulfovibrionaceae bacterium]|nr:riboflavin kinase [Desulfovibrionaceae bacterium]
NDRVSVESFLPETDINLYNRQINLHFVQRLRDEQRFASVEELKARIARDVDLARRILASPEAALKR